MKNFYPQIIKANASLLLATFIITTGAFHTPRRKPHAMQLSSRASNNDSWQRRNNDNRNPPSYYYEPRGNEYLNADYFTEDYYRNGSMDRRPEGYYDDGANYRDPFLGEYLSVLLVCLRCIFVDDEMYSKHFCSASKVILAFIPAYFK